MNAYLHGPSLTPLLGETIGRTCAARWSVSAIARRSSSGRRAFARPIASSGTRRPAGARAARVGCAAGRPRRHLVAQSLRVGRHAVRHRAHRRDPRQHQPRLQDGRARVRAARSRASACCCHARAFRQSDYVRDARRGPAALPARCAKSSCSTTTGMRSARRGARGRRERELAAREAIAAVRRPDQHPVHVRHDRASRRAPRSRTTTS